MGRSSRPYYPSKNVDEAESFFVESLEMFFQAENLQQFVLAGHSFGGYVSGCYTVHYPHRVKQLILISAVGVKLKPENYDWHETVRNMPSWRTRSYFKFMAWIFRKKISPADLLKKLGPFSGKLLKKFTKKRFPDVRKEVKDSLNDYLEQMALLPGSGEYALYHIVEMGIWARKPLAEQLATVTVPMAFFYGDEDWMSPGGAVEVAERTEASVYIEIIPGAGHHVYMDNPHQLAASMIEQVRNPTMNCEKYSVFMHYHVVGR